MADILQFPDLAQRANREMQQIIEEQFVKRGIPGPRAQVVAREMVEDYREFERIMGTKALSFPTNTEAESKLAHDAVNKCANTCKEVWLEQRFLSEVRQNTARP